MITITMNNLLGGDRDVSVKDIKQSHMKLLRRNQLRVSEMYCLVLYFQEKFKIRRERLQTKILQSCSINNIKSDHTAGKISMMQ